MTPPVFSGGHRTIAIASSVGVAGLILTALRGLSDARLALASYLVAFCYWIGLSLGALVLLMVLHAAKAKWSVVLRRVIEVMASSLSIAPLLFVPIALHLRTLYPWAGSAAGLDEETALLLAHRASYLNPTFFLARAAVFFAVWITLSQLLLRWSVSQDRSGARVLTVRGWVLGAGGLPIVGLTLTLASIDWLMSLSVNWYSTIWGIYFFAGSFVGAIALLIILVAILHRTSFLANAIQTAHWLSLGKFLLAFVCFWGYIAFSQYLLVWIGNLPDTVPWLLVRQNQQWRWIGVTLAVGHFLLPFFLLLSRRRKMDPVRLGKVAAWILIVHYIDVYWLVMPQIRPGSVLPDWSTLTAFAGIGGVMLVVGILILRGRYAFPIRDPFLADSLGYSKMR